MRQQQQHPDQDMMMFVQHMSTWHITQCTRKTHQCTQTAAESQQERSKCLSVSGHQFKRWILESHHSLSSHLTATQQHNQHAQYTPMHTQQTAARKANVAHRLALHHHRQHEQPKPTSHVIFSVS
jgi:hypothetical protein